VLAARIAMAAAAGVVATTLTVRDMLYLYCDARSVYERFIGMGSHPEQARNAVALLLWLDQAFHQAMPIRHLPTLDATAVSMVASEANRILHCLQQQSHHPAVLPPIPFISALCQCHDGGIDTAFNQDLVVRGVADILDGVGALIFDDRLYSLSELEAPYTCRPVTVPEDCRSMFVTFSKGQPAVDRQEIFDYFRQ
jgi:hypothetical protein